MSPTLRNAWGQLLTAITASVIGSLVIVWALSRVFSSHFDPGLVAALSAVLSAAVAGPRLLRPGRS